VKSQHFLSLAVLLAFCGATALAQTNPNIENGLKPFGSYDGSDVDSVDLWAGGLTVHIPLFSYPQRGTLKSESVMALNSKIFKVFQNCNHLTGVCNDSWKLNTFGNQYPYPFGISIRGTGLLGPYWTYNTTYGYVYTTTTWDGAVHQMALNTANNTTYEATDNSGIWNDGLRNPNYFGLVKRSNGDFASQDTNGNFFSSTADTIGRTSPASTSTTDYSGCGGPVSQITSAGIGYYPGPNGTNTQVKVCQTSVSLKTNFHAHNVDMLDPQFVAEYTGSTNMVQSVVVYNGTSWATSPAWTFEYIDRDPTDTSDINYGSLSKITFPTGGSITYKYQNVFLCESESVITPANRGVISRSIDANDGTGPHTTNYTTTVVNGFSVPVQIDPLGNETLHTFSGLSGSCTYYETLTKYYQGTHTTGTLLKTVQTDYSSQPNHADVVGDGAPTAINVLPIRITTTLDNGKVSKVEKDYDSNLHLIFNGAFTESYGNVMEMREYDYGSGAPGPLVRRTDYTYKEFDTPSYLAANILHKVSSATVYNGAGTQVAKTTYGYDEYTLQPSGVTVNFTSTGSGIPRGNQTSVKRWLNTTGGTLNTTTTYFDTGMPYQVTDPLGHVTTFSYSSTYAGGYVTQTNMPDTGSPAVHHVVSGSYDFNIGKLTTFTDQNNQPSNYAYDSLWRISSATYPDGGQKTFNYPDLLTIERKNKLDVTPHWTDSYSYFDGLGRPIQTQLVSDPQGTTYTVTNYDVLSRVSLNYNPTRCTTPTTNCGEPTWGFTTTQYDPLNRVTKLIPPDGTTSSNNVTTVYSGNCTTVTDQQGRARKSCTDGLGRLTQIFEDPASFNYETDYTYDVLNNLLTVNQKGNDPNSADWRTRTFTYDSLSRLLTASNPESGSVTYTYDADGNIQTKVSPAPNQTGSATVTTCFGDWTGTTCNNATGYDALNRLLRKTYSDGTTPAVSYVYDVASSSACTPNTLTITYGVGRRTGMCDAAGSEAWAYDQMGRVLADKRTSNNVGKTTSYTYNFDGSEATLTYPSGRVITYSLQTSGTNSAGRMLSAVDVPNSVNYATAASYVPSGALTSLTNGASVVSTLYFNSRFQPCRISAKFSGTAPASCADSANTGNILDFTYDFGLGSADNGNVLGITNNRNSARSQLFAYDSVNRIATAKTSSVSGTYCWDEQFGYDPWGNLLSIGRIAGYSCSNEETLSVITTTKNQISGDTYDSAGNLIVIPGTGGSTYVYNAENQLKQAISGGVTTNYAYDGDGKRVEKLNSSNAVTKIYWYGVGSGPLDETDNTGVITNAAFHEFIFFNGNRIARRDSTNAVNYYFSDHLGTSRIVTSSSGSVLDDSDFYPFGGERIISASSGNTYKFTSKERDSESGLDYFGARHNASNSGRFTSPDPIFLHVLRVMDPQRLNLYTYARNNPLVFLDPTGKDIVPGTGDQKAIKVALVEIAKHPGGRELLNKLDKLSIKIPISTGSVPSGDYGLTKGKFTSSKDPETGKLDAKGGPVQITVDLKLAKADREENQAGKALGLEPKHDTVPSSDQQQLGHELSHLETRVETGKDNTEDQATGRIDKILAEPTDMNSKDAGKFVEELLKPNEQNSQQQDTSPSTIVESPAPE